MKSPGDPLEVGEQIRAMIADAAKGKPLAEAPPRPDMAQLPAPEPGVTNPVVYALAAALAVLAAAWGGVVDWIRSIF
jgi:hypothetical protein